MSEEKNQLLELIEKISKLSEKETKLRDIYLRKIATGEVLGPVTGYASLDKPWLKYYETFKNIDNMKKTVYQSLYDNNKKYKNEIAIEYFGAKISFGKLLKNIDNTANALEANGIKKGDFVTICAPGIPETIYTFYALSKIGGVANMIANHFEKKDFIDRIKDCNSEFLIVMDSFYEEIKDTIEESGIKKVIVVPTLNSSPLKIFSKKIQNGENKNIFLWNQFISEGKKIKNSSKVDYEPNMPLVMVYSSGTTGASKGILLSVDSFQNSIKAYFDSGLDITRGQKFYQIIPTWYSTGISTSVHLPLSCGAPVYMDPRFERDIFVKNIIKAKPNYCIAPTSMYEGLLNNKKLKNKDLSYFRNAFEGGEPLNKELSEQINDIFRKHNNNTSIKVGYGQCECGATVTTQTDNTQHCNGSVGIPLPSLNISIFNQNFNEVTTGNRGLICVDTPSSMLGYYKNQEATNKYFYIDENGKKWNCTGDIGFIDENGNLFVEGRATDYSIFNGQIIYNFDIENIIKQIPDIKM